MDLGSEAGEQLRVSRVRAPEVSELRAGEMATGL